MEKSLFFKWLATRFSATISRFSETMNGLKGDAPKYLFMQYLKKNFSVDLKWASLNGNGASVAADVVSLDSSVPLKKRDSLTTIEGDVPKIGMKKRKSEREMQDLQILEATNKGGNRTAQILAKLFNDPLAVTRGVYERLEYMFLQGLSSGFTEHTDANNEGVAIRIDYGYNDENIFGAEVKWSESSATPISDINRIVESRSQKGRGTSYMFMDLTAWNNFKSKAEVREMYAASIGFNGTNAPTPNLDQANAALTSNKLPMIIIIDRSVNIEKNGIRTAVKPWATAAVVFTDTLDLGDLTYSTLVEANNPAKEVLYATADDYILVSTWHTKDPFSEITSSQALVLPVINDVEGISVLNSEEAQVITGQTEEDATITIYEDSNVTVANLVNALNAVGVTASTEMTDVQLIKLVNKLSNKKETELKAILEIPVVSAGADDTANSATKALLGTATAEGDKTIASVLWSQVSGPNSAGFSAPTALSTNATGLVTGVYVFKLTATDSAGTVASDTVTITATVA